MFLFCSFGWESGSPAGGGRDNHMPASVIAGKLKTFQALLGFSRRESGDRIHIPGTLVPSPVGAALNRSGLAPSLRISRRRAADARL